MKCADCGGLVTWRGPLTDLTHTECESCGGRNCQEPEWPEPDGSEHADGLNPAPAAPIGARDPVGFAQHLLSTSGVLAAPPVLAPAVPATPGGGLSTDGVKGTLNDQGEKR